MKIKNRYILSFLMLSFSFSSLYASDVFADKLELKLTPIIKENTQNNNQNVTKKNLLQGDIAISEEKKIIPSWQKGQNEIELVFSGLIKDLEDGKVDNYIPDLNKDALEQLAATYLFCSRLQGPCEFILESLLELETLRSVKNNDISCSGLKQFWKIWIDNNYEKQLNYDLKLGLIERTKEFQKSTMPKYIQCEKTIKEVFGKDYISNKEKVASIKKTQKLVTLLGKKYGDISYQFMNN